MVSKLCHYFIQRGRVIEGVAEDARARRYPIPSGGLEVKLLLTFKGLGVLVDHIKQLIREAYSWDYTGEQPLMDEPEGENDEEAIEL